MDSIKKKSRPRRKVVLTVVDVKKHVPHPTCPHNVGDRFVIKGPTVYVNECDNFCIASLAGVSSAIFGLKYGVDPKSWECLGEDGTITCHDRERVVWKIDIFEGDKRVYPEEEDIGYETEQR